MKLKLILFLLVSLLDSRGLWACSLCSGNGYAGAYSTGGYNLYTFATDIYTIVDTVYYAPVNVGGCGLLSSSCGSCFSSPGLYGSNTGYNPNTQLINQLLLNQINQNTMQMCMMSGMCNPANPFLTPPGSIPPVMPPTPPIYGGYPNPYFPSPISPTFPYDPNLPNYNPYLPNYPYSQPPVTQLPYGGCDNVIVMCPVGPVSPQSPTWPNYPNYNPWNWNPSSGVTNPNPSYPVSNPSVPGSNPTTINVNTPVTPNVDPGTQWIPNPVFSPNSQTVPDSPIRYQLPRGVHRTH